MKIYDVHTSRTIQTFCTGVGPGFAQRGARLPDRGDYKTGQRVSF